MERTDGYQTSFDAVDSLRRRLTLALVAVTLMAAVGAVELFTVSRFSEPLEEHIRSWTVLLLFCIAGAALAVCLHITRMTKRILRAIELSPKT